MSQNSQIKLKSKREVEYMRESGRLVFKVLSTLTEMVRPRITTSELNVVAEEIIESAGATALFKGVKSGQARFPFPAALCTSVNEEVVHGIPGDRVLNEGDIVSIDCGVCLNGYCGDAATTIPVGKVSKKVRNLLDATLGALDVAILEIRAGKNWSNVAKEMQKYVENKGLSIVRDFVGHGIGQEMHEEPKLPNYWDRRQEKYDVVLRPGMTIAVEPMVNIGTSEVIYSDTSCWPAVTKDGKWSAHFEHSLAVTENGVSVLTE